MSNSNELNYTYRQLLEALQELTEDELDLSVTLYDLQREEYYPLDHCNKTKEADVLDSDHPILIFNNSIEENKNER